MTGENVIPPELPNETSIEVSPNVMLIRIFTGKQSHPGLHIERPDTDSPDNQTEAIE